LQESASVVCDYGAAGVALAAGDLDRAGILLERLVKQYPYSYLYQALGDYYQGIGEDKKALRYYFSALRTTDNAQERQITKQKIRQTADDVSSVSESDLQ
jgi:tetratricopeptide (TPR) repeat protein